MSETLASRVLVVDRSNKLVEELRQAHHVGERPELVHLARTTEVVKTVTEQGPWDVVVAGPSEASRAGLQRLAALREVAPTVGLLAAVNGTDPSDLRTFVRAQPDELIRLPAGRAKLRTALAKVVDAAATRRQTRTSAAPALPVQGGRVHVVGGPTGGCGKTTVAINLAALHAAAGQRVVLVDADWQFGEVTTALQLHPVHTCYDAVFDEHDRRVPEVEIAESLPETLTDTGHGFSLMAAPGDPVAADHLTGEDLGTLLDVLRTHADVVVVDCATGLNAVTLAALDRSDHTVAVCEVDVPSVANLRTFLSTLDALGVDEQHRSVLFNKELPDSGVTADEAADVIGSTSGALSFTPAVVRSLNYGRPFCAAEPDHPTAQALRDALRPLWATDDAHGPPPGDASEATPTSATAGGNGGWWRRARRRGKDTR